MSRISLHCLSGREDGLTVLATAEGLMLATQSCIVNRLAAACLWHRPASAPPEGFDKECKDAPHKPQQIHSTLENWSSLGLNFVCISLNHTRSRSSGYQWWCESYKGIPGMKATRWKSNLLPPAKRPGISGLECLLRSASCSHQVGHIFHCNTNWSE